MKNILGLDLGTNSIGWALLKADENSDNPLPHKIEMAGSRIIPMDAAAMSEFDRGTSISQTAKRTAFRGIRRLYDRHQLRRARLHVLLTHTGF